MNAVVKWKNQLPDWAALMVQNRIDRDSIWCLPCGLADRPKVKPVTKYMVATPGDRPAEVPCCRNCLNQAMSDGINIVALVPVANPSHVEFLQELLRGVP